MELIGTSTDPRTRLPIIILEYAMYKTLDTLLFNPVEQLDWSTRLQMAENICLGLECLHVLDV